MIIVRFHKKSPFQWQVANGEWQGNFKSFVPIDITDTCPLSLITPGRVSAQPYLPTFSVGDCITSNIVFEARHVAENCLELKEQTETDRLPRVKEKRNYKRFELIPFLAILGCAGMLLFECVFIFELYDRAPAQVANLISIRSDQHTLSLPEPSVLDKSVPAPVATNVAPLSSEPAAPAGKEEAPVAPVAPAEAPPARIDSEPAAVPVG
jgi:hypothetical protein